MKQKAAWMLVLGLGISLGSSPGHSQSWPQKAVMIIVPFAAGGGTDAFMRPLGVQFDQQMGTRFLIENRAGGGGTIGAAAAARAAPDGYTFFAGAAHHTIAPAVYPNLTYNIQTDFIPIGMVARPSACRGRASAQACGHHALRAHHVRARQSEQDQLRLGRRRYDASSCR